MKSRSQDEINVSNIKFIFGNLIQDRTLFCRLNINTNKGVYKIMSRWVELYEKNEKIN